MVFLKHIYHQNPINPLNEVKAHKIKNLHYSRTNNLNPVRSTTLGYLLSFSSSQQTIPKSCKQAAKIKQFNFTNNHLFNHISQYFTYCIQYIQYMHLPFHKHLPNSRINRMEPAQRLETITANQQIIQSSHRL